MSETKIICSVIIFTLGIYTLLLLQYELSKLNNLNVNNKNSNEDEYHACSNTTVKTKLDLDRLNCGSAGDLSNLHIQNCSQLPCDIIPNVSYSVELNFLPSRNITSVEIQTYVRQRKDLKYLHKETVHTTTNEKEATKLKFSFNFPPQPVFNARKMKTKSKKCVHHNVYLLGVEIWDIPSGVGEICLIIPMDVSY